MGSKLFENFVGVYPVSKTLRFELRPIGRTREYIERDGIIDTDTARAENYMLVKKMIDEYHKAFIESSLKGLSLDGLDDYYRLYNKSKRTEKEEKEFTTLQAKMRKTIAQTFKKNSAFKTIDKKELIKKDMMEFFKTDSEKLCLIKGFADFTTYFTGFHQNRQNMYSEEEKSTAISYRVVHQNLPKYIDNIKIFNNVSSTSIMDQIQDLQKALSDVVPDMQPIESYFEVAGFNQVIGQSGIDVYNTIIGGYTKADGQKIQGLNEYINLYCQRTKEKIPKLKPLFKQILSDRDSASFIPEMFETDTEVFDAINELYAIILENVLESKEEISIADLMTGIGQNRLDGIYVSNDTSITALSQGMFSDWSVLKNAIGAAYDAEHPVGRMSQEKYDEKKQKELKKVKNYSISFLNSLIENTHVEHYFTSSIMTAIESIYKTFETYADIDVDSYSAKRSLKNNDKDISKIKDFLDQLKGLQWALKPLTGGFSEPDKDERFYVELQRIWEVLDMVTPLYNKVRNYVTGKPYSTEKVKLNFGRSTLLDGWDKNKERNNLGIILQKDGLYYLAIMNRNNTKCIDVAPEAESKSRYQKMNYKLLPGPNKMLPKVFFSKSRIDEFAPSPEIKASYDSGTHKKGQHFNLDDCYRLIDFFKESINKHEDWSQFGFKFSDTKNYADISEFYKEVSQQGYKITFTDIDESYIDSLVDAGSLYLFQIYNKDFSPYSKGTPNLHTLYWKALFSPENLKDVVYKLNGQAEVFFRKASIKPEDIIVHPAQQEIANKDPLNSKAYSCFEYDIVKDRRYTCDKFQFHVPITMNFKADGENYMNLRVNKAVHEADEMHIIGIDRGERNLLYVSVIDMNGNIVKQMSLNDILTYDSENKEHRRDYHQMLVTREKENIKARQNWTTTNTIKELKEGYLSQVIHVITTLMVEYNAIVVLEDLNFGFKRGRQKFERQVYQKFEKMLIDKLNYYVDKKRPASEDGGVLRAYQLTSKFTSFQSMGKQSGFLYYVPAWNTSKIDPTTGFVNLFYTRYESIEKSKLFINQFDAIRFNENENVFEFEFDYDVFTYKAEGTKTKWTIVTSGTRIDHFRNPQKNNEWDVKYVDLTSAFDELFQMYGVDIHSENMIDSIISIDVADFYKKFLKLFSLTLQMRNSDENQGIDCINSPVRNLSGDCFVSGRYEHLPMDADANGAYNIAKKGLMLVDKIKATNESDLSKIKLTITNKEWIRFAQEHTI